VNGGAWGMADWVAGGGRGPAGIGLAVGGDRPADRGAAFAAGGPPDPGASGAEGQELGAAELCAVARQLNAASDRRLGASHQLAASLLLRQALEEALADWWDGVLLGVAGCSSRAQLVTLPFYLHDAALAHDVVFAWNRLSAICHHRVYELAPDPSEVERLLVIVGRFVDAVERRHRISLGEEAE
jgi:hypothetical protein